MMSAKKLFFENTDITEMCHGMNYGDGNVPEPGFEDEYVIAVYHPSTSNPRREVLKVAEFSHYWEFCEWLQQCQKCQTDFTKTLWFVIIKLLDQWNMPIDPTTGDVFVLPGAIQVTAGKVTAGNTGNNTEKKLRLYGVDGISIIKSQRLIKKSQRLI